MNLYTPVQLFRFNLRQYSGEPMSEFYHYTSHSRMQNKESSQRSLRRLKRLLYVWLILFLAAMLYALLGV